MSINDILQWTAIVIIFVTVAVVLVRKIMKMRRWTRRDGSDRCCNCTGCTGCDAGRRRRHTLSDSRDNHARGRGPVKNRQAQASDKYNPSK